MTGFPKHSFKTLDGVRGVAAIAVMFSHFDYVMPMPVFKSGYLAVDIFFCLSGFVVACAYERRLRAEMTFGAFVKTRLVRLWPMTALGVACGALIYAISAHVYPPDPPYDHFWTTVALNMAFIPMVFGASDVMFFVDHPEWSLFYELAINILYAAFLRFLRLPVIVVILAVSATLVVVGVVRFGNANFGWERSQVLFGFARVAYSFFVGVLLFRYRDRFAGLRSRYGALLVLLATAVSCTLPVGGLRTSFDSLFILIGAPLLVVWGSFSDDDGPVDRVSVLLGTISYPLYSIHFPLAVAAGFLSTMFPVLRVPIAATIMIVALPLSYLLAKTYDEPVRRRLSRALGLGGGASRIPAVAK
jgi:peptidoglycan/LPS O-acetylase OafA/YrhL